MAADHRVSVTDAVQSSATWTKTILFDRFSWSKWFILGFCAFLANLGRGGGGGGNFNPNAFGRGGDMDGLRRVGEWAVSHLPLILTLGGAILLVAVALGLLLSWVSCRGEFMFLEGVVKDRAAVEEPWFRFARLGNSLFFFRLVLGVGVLTTFALVLLLCWGVAQPSLSGWRFDGNPWLALGLGLLVLVPVALAVWAVHLLLRDFVVPIMYRKELGTLAAFRLFFSDVLGAHLAGVVLFYLLKLALALVAGIAMFLGILFTCCFCCTAAIPLLGGYVVAVAFLPVFVFFRCYPLYFLEQMGEEWRFFEGPAPQAPPGPPEDSSPQGEPALP